MPLFKPAPPACPLCGASHATCTVVEGSGTPIEIMEGGPVVGELKPYAAVVNGFRTTLMLTAAEAKERGLLEEKADDAEATVVTTTETTVATPSTMKARTPQNKGA